MSLTKRNCYTSGQFAQIHGLNKRTLQYYAKIGLFTPAYVGENGYHYYTSVQSVQLEWILALREMGFSIEEIQRYNTATSQDEQENFVQLLRDKQIHIAETIEKLSSVQLFLQKKLDKMELGSSVYHGKIELVPMKERRILLSQSLRGKSAGEAVKIATDFSQRLKETFGLYDNFGSRVDTAQILAGNYTDTDAFFAYGRNHLDVYDVVEPAGIGLRGYCVGAWDKIGDVYQNMIQFASSHGLRLTGYSYEEGLNELFLQKENDYITMISVACAPLEAPAPQKTK